MLSVILGLSMSDCVHIHVQKFLSYMLFWIIMSNSLDSLNLNLSIFPCSLMRCFAELMVKGLEVKSFSKSSVRISIPP
jgi:hypothetical protein